MYRPIITDCNFKKSLFIGYVNKLGSNFGKLQSKVLINLFKSYCCSCYGSAVIKLNNDIIGGMDEELSAAFDTVDHDILLRRLQNVYGIDETALLWFKLYLKDRTHRVYIKETLSERQNLDCGVPQGSVLGAKLYSMYAYPLCTIINEHNLHYHSYADDTQIYMQCDNNENAITDVIVRLENCIKDISSWMMHNSLQINENKTDFIIFSTTPHKLKSIHYKLELIL